MAQDLAQLFVSKFPVLIDFTFKLILLEYIDVAATFHK